MQSLCDMKFLGNSCADGSTALSHGTNDREGEGFSRGQEEEEGRVAERGD